MLLFFGFALLLTARLSLAEVTSRRQDQQSMSNVRAAVDANPRLSLGWIRLGLHAESEGNLAEAEADLLQAARVDRQYLPAWTLSNFYFRRDDRANFWPWARRAAALTFDDYRPLLRLADALDASPREVIARLQGGTPLYPLVRAYLDLLIGAGRLEAAQEVALVLDARHDPSDRLRLADLAARRKRAGTP